MTSVCPAEPFSVFHLFLLDVVRQLREVKGGALSVRGLVLPLYPSKGGRRRLPARLEQPLPVLPVDELWLLVVLVLLQDGLNERRCVNRGVYVLMGQLMSGMVMRTKADI